MRRLAYLFLTALVLSISNVCGQVQATRQFVNSDGLSSAGIGISIKDVATGKTIAEYQSKTNRIPASVTKVLTTASAMEMLTDSFHFETKVYLCGEVKDSVLDGDVYVVGGGDPTLESDFFPHTGFFGQVANAFKAAGIKRIDGKIVGDGSLYQQSGVPGDWLVEDVGTYYGQTPSALSFNDNLMFVTMIANDSSQQTEVQSILPKNRLLHINNLTKVGQSMWWKVHGDSYSWDKTIRGRIPAVKKTLVKMEMPDPSFLVADSLSHVLADSGIVNQGSRSTLWTGERAQKDSCIYTHYSLPLRDIIKVTNHQSVNLFAENIFLYLGLKNSETAESSVSVKTIARLWESKGISTEHIHQVDGSGLSMKNALNPDFLTDVLVYMKKDTTVGNAFVSTLPTAGVSGTVKGFLAGTALKGKVLAKSGSMDRVQNYAGYIIWKGKWYAFAIMINNFDCSRKELKKNLGNYLTNVMKLMK